jgi:uncharacterized protein (TIGR02996 family)
MANDPEYDALYAAVCAAPDEDTPRLVLADWLDEHDDPHRAAYMRAEVQLHRLRENDPHASACFSAPTAMQEYDWSKYHDAAEVSPAVARLDELHKLSQKHAKKAEARWKTVLGKRTAGQIIIYERGFPHCISIGNAKQYAKAAAKLPPESLPGYSLFVHKASDPGFDDVLACKNFARATGFTVFNVGSPDTVRKLGARPEVRNFRSLSITFEESDNAILTAIATQPNWCALESLSVSHSYSGRAGELDLPEEFAKAAHLRTLTSLSLNIKGLSGAGLARLSWLRLPRLRSLMVGYNRLGFGITNALLVGAFPELRHLDANHNAIPNDGAAALVDHHAHLPLLASLNLANNNITDPKLLAALIAGPCYPALVALSLRENPIRDLDAKTLAAPGRGPTLRFLNLRHCGMPASAAKKLLTAPALANLLCIDLAGCALGDEGAKAVASSKWERLSCLDLAHNAITSEGVKALTAWPGVAKLAYLNLRDNPIGLDGAKALAGCKLLKKCRKLVIPSDEKQLPVSGRALLQTTFGKRIAYH